MSAKSSCEDLINANNINKKIKDGQLKIASSEIRVLRTESKTATDRIKDLQSVVDSLKSDVQGVVGKTELNMDGFKEQLSNKVMSVLTLISNEEGNIQATLDRCYQITSSLIEMLLSVGYGLDRDVAAVSSRLNDLDSNLKKIRSSYPLIDTLISQTDENGCMWYINSDGRLSKRNCKSFGPVLADFNYGDKNLRQKFILQLTELFKQYQVPQSVWVKLATSQFNGVAQEWWYLNCKKNENMTWEKFSKIFIDSTINDNNSGNDNFSHTINNNITRKNNRLNWGSSCSKINVSSKNKPAGNIDKVKRYSSENEPCSSHHKEPAVLTEESIDEEPAESRNFSDFLGLPSFSDEDYAGNNLFGSNSDDGSILKFFGSVSEGNSSVGDDDSTDLNRKTKRKRCR